MGPNPSPEAAIEEGGILPGSCSSLRQLRGSSVVPGLPLNGASPGIPLGVAQAGQGGPQESEGTPTASLHPTISQDGHPGQTESGSLQNWDVS